MNKFEQKIDEIEIQRNHIVIEVGHIENMLKTLDYIDEEEIIKISVIKTTLENISYRVKNINKILEKIDELTFL